MLVYSIECCGDQCGTNFFVWIVLLWYQMLYGLDFLCLFINWSNDYVVPVGLTTCWIRNHSFHCLKKKTFFKKKEKVVNEYKIVTDQLYILVLRMFLLLVYRICSWFLLLVCFDCLFVFFYIHKCYKIVWEQSLEVLTTYNQSCYLGIQIDSFGSLVLKHLWMLQLIKWLLNNHFNSISIQFIIGISQELSCYGLFNLILVDFLY